MAQSRLDNVVVRTRYWIEVYETSGGYCAKLFQKGSIFEGYSRIRTDRGRAIKDCIVEGAVQFSSNRDFGIRTISIVDVSTPLPD
jgi:hypothetical protein